MDTPKDSPERRYRRAARLLGAKLGIDWQELPTQQVEDYMRKLDFARRAAGDIPEQHDTYKGGGDGTKRADIRPGITVRVVQKQDQGSGKLTTGVVDRILTSSPNHSRGIKVRLQDGTVGRVQEIVKL